MDAFVARQPIFALDLSVYGYELLFRSSFENVFSSENTDHASAKVIADSSSLFRFDNVVRGKKAFVNVTRETLLADYVRLLPSERTVVELLETVKPDAEVVEACRSLKQAGYLIALDDFVYEEAYEPLIELADIIKVDWLATTQVQRAALIERTACSPVRLLAEKVETQEAFESARAEGFSLFQGYFFCKPVVLSTKDIRPSKLSNLLILKEINQPELNFDEIEEIIKREVSLAYRFLTYLNSAHFGWKTRVDGIRRGLTLLGERETKKWVSVAALTLLADDKPEELVLHSVVRAKFCESIGSAVGLEDRTDDLFLMGLFSLLEAILDRPLPSVLEQLSLADDVKAALTTGHSRLRDVFDCVLAYERGSWLELLPPRDSLGSSETTILYLNAVDWADQALGGCVTQSAR